MARDGAKGSARAGRDGARRRAAGMRDARRRAAPRNRLVIVAVALVALVVAALLYARSFRGTGGALATLDTGDFHALLFAADDPDLVFFGHHGGILRSADGGRAWTPLVERRGFDAMGLARGDARRLYAAGHDVFEVSDDGGRSWQAVAHTLPGTDIHGFAVSPDDPQRLYAFVTGHGLLTSADGGRGWQRLEGQLPGDVMALASAGGQPETLYAGSGRSGLLRSVDGGRTWSPVTRPPGAGGVYALAVDPAAGGTVYAAGEGFYKTTDGGGTWTKVAFPIDNVVAVAVSPARPARVLAIGVRDQRGLVYRSDDGGHTWTAGR